ncbi:KAP family NTPase [Thiolapillus sp.]
MSDEKKSVDALTFEDRDEFQRKPIAEKVVRLLMSGIEASPMVIDGNWGTGKTEFCHKLINLLREADDAAQVQVAYVDAFKADHANEPLMTLIAAISNLIEDEETAKNFKEKAIPALRYGLKTLGKAGIAWILKKNADDIPDEFEEVLQEAAEDSINAAIEQSIKDHQDIEAALVTLQKALEQIAQEKPLILFIDELDRCKPDFAIAMLENIKHVFDVPNVQFVLVSNLRQLKDSINHCYGAGVDAQKYLDKFIKYSLQLPADFSPDRYNYTLAAVEHAKQLMEKSSLLQNSDFSKRNGLFQFLEILIRENELSLREVETFVRHLEIAQLLGGEKYFTNIVFGVELLRLIGVYIYSFEKDAANKIVSEKTEALAITRTFGIWSFAETEQFDHNPSHQQVMARILMLENQGGVEGVSERNKNNDDGWKKEIAAYFSGSLRHGMDGYYTKVIADTVRMLQLGV